MPRLIYHTGACSLGPHIVLEWIGAPYEAQNVEFGAPELLAANPAGAVPALIEDDGWILTQASAILKYLAHKHPEAGLGGDADLRGQAELDRWMSFATGDIHSCFYPVFLPQRYTPRSDKEALAEAQEAGKQLARKKFALLDKHLEGREWMVGKRSVADAQVFPMIRWAAAVLPEGISGWKNVQALHDRLAADPAVQRVLAREAGK